MKIIDCTIGPYPRSFFDIVQPNVTVTFEDGTEKVLFAFYHDEISFRTSEFIGLTEDESHKLHGDKDTAYIRR